MNRSLLLATLVVFAGVVLGLVLLLRGGTAPEPMASGDVQTVAAPQQVEGGEGTKGENRPINATTQRVAVNEAKDAAEEDPEIRAALSGFRGRVVDHGGAPVGNTGVRLLRLAGDSLFRPGVDLMSDVETTPQYLAGETRTGGDGTFLLGGVWPRAFFILHVGVGSDAPGHRFLDRTPNAGEVVDLGDIQLDDAAVVVGKVVDEDGKAVAGALVRAADVPGQLAGLFPIERFDPDGCLIVREKGGPPTPVVEMPKWAKQVFADLPIPATTTASDGSFRLVGVTPGSNMMATTKRGLLADVKPSLQVKAGQVKDVGTIKLKAGEELTGRVLDAAGKPVADAEVVAGGTISVAPVDLGVRVGKTDAEGRFHAEGFPAGKVTVAARAARGHAWIVAEPQLIAGEVIVTLPALCAITVAVTGVDGALVKEPKLRLLAGGERGGALEMASLGFMASVDLGGHVSTLADGRQRIANLQTGKYRLLAQTAGTGIGGAQVDLQADVDVAISLAAPHTFTVQVLDPDGQPLRSTAIYYKERGKEMFDMPVAAGRTGADGKRVIDTANTPKIRITATHPKYGTVHADGEHGKGDVLMQMQRPVSIEGVLTEVGALPKPGKWTIAIEHRVSGAFEDPPTLTVPDLQGKFALRSVQPGTYQINVLSSLSILRTPGTALLEMQRMSREFGGADRASTSTDVAPGATAHVQLDVGNDVVTGPSGRVSGSVVIDGRIASDTTVALQGEHSKSTKTDSAGRFDFGQVRVGNVSLQVLRNNTSAGFFDRPQPLYNTWFELKEGEEHVADISVQTSSFSGVVIGLDGAPVAHAWVQANARIPRDNGKGDDWSWFGEQTAADGTFHFKQVVAGRYSLDVRGNDGAGRGRLHDVEVRAGQPVDGLRIALEKQVTVTGRVDLSVFGEKPEWAWLAFQAFDPEATAEHAWDRQVAGAGVDAEGNFHTDELPPGRYRARVYCNKAEDGEWWTQGEIVVGTADIKDVVLVPAKVQRRG